jgi:hypothetical protein
VDGGVGGDGVEGLSDHHDVVSGLHSERCFDDLQAGHHLQRSDEVERRQPGIEHESDGLDVLAHCALSPPVAVSRTSKLNIIPLSMCSAM